MFQTQIRNKSGNTLETLSEQILEFLSSVRLEVPKSWKTKEIYIFWHFHNSVPLSGTEKVPQKNFCDKDLAGLLGELFGCDLPQNPLFYWVVPSNCSENSLVLFVRFCWVWGSFWFLTLNTYGLDPFFLRKWPLH